MKTQGSTETTVGREAVQMEVRMGQGRNKDGPALEAEGVKCGSGGIEMP